MRTSTYCAFISKPAKRAERPNTAHNVTNPYTTEMPIPTGKPQPFSCRVSNAVSPPTAPPMTPSTSTIATRRPVVMGV